jgi:hypothetical protein
MGGTGPLSSPLYQLQFGLSDVTERLPFRSWSRNGVINGGKTVRNVGRIGRSRAAGDFLKFPSLVGINNPLEGVLKFALVVWGLRTT